MSFWGLYACCMLFFGILQHLSLIHISEPTRLGMSSYAPSWTHDDGPPSRARRPKSGSGVWRGRVEFGAAEACPLRPPGMS